MGKKRVAQRAKPAYSAPKQMMAALEKLRNKPVIITFHSLGDTDAVASALALAAELGPKAVIAPADRTNSESRRLMSWEMKKFISFETARAKFPDAKIILLDANDPSILPQFGGRAAACRPFILIDHHSVSRASVRAKTEWVEPESSSACELVADLIIHPSSEQARWLILGILSDSAHLMRADANTFAALSRLIPLSSQSYEQLLNELRHPNNATCRAAVLEGLRQCTWKLQGERLLASAIVSSHESHVADALISAGADVAVAGTSDKKGARISARVRASLADEMDLPAIMRETGRALGGMGGGHPGAAGASGPRGERLEDAIGLALRLCAKVKV